MQQSKIIDHLSSDKKLQEIIGIIPFPKLESTRDVFHDLMSCIIEQQIHYRSTKKIFQKILDQTNIERVSVDNFEEFELGFDNIKITTSKFETIERTLDFFSKNQLDWTTMTDSEVKKNLSSIKGIGVWTIEMILLYTLRRENIFPADDYHLKQVMTSIYKLDTRSRLKAQMKEVAAQWTPYKSYASLYLLGWKNFQKENKKY